MIRQPMSADAPFLALLRQVHRISRRDELEGHAERVRAVAAFLAAQGADALEIADLSGRAAAALVRRLAALFETERPPPAPWAWLALGSGARREQPLPTDQDHALAFAASTGAEEWAAALADRLEQDLAAAGLPPCKGGLMASRWKADLGTWCGRIEGWMEDPEPLGLLVAAALADARRIAGRLDVAPLRAALARAPAHPRFLRELARAALEFRPPAAVLARLGVVRLDLERDALAPMVLVARVYGLAAGSPARGTCARIEAAREAGLLGADAAQAASTAHRVLLGLRLRTDLAAGGPARTVDVASLPRAERNAALQALDAVRQLQDRAEHRFLR
jgi:CBS domain-containing protein